MFSACKLWSQAGHDAKLFMSYCVLVQLGSTGLTGEDMIGTFLESKSYGNHSDFEM